MDNSCVMCLYKSIFDHSFFSVNVHFLGLYSSVLSLVLSVVLLIIFLVIFGLFISFNFDLILGFMRRSWFNGHLLVCIFSNYILPIQITTPQLINKIQIIL